MRLRRIETALAWFSLGALVVYVPLETWVSWPHLDSPGYVVDVIAFALLLYGGAHSLSVRPRSGIAPLCAAWGFCACLGWRSYFMRVVARQKSLAIYEGEPPIVGQVVGVATIIAFAALVLCLWIAHRRSGRREA